MTSAKSDKKKAGSAKARDTARRTAESASENPLALLAGGIALGVLVGVLLPRFAREKEALRPIGKRIADGATAAADAAREVGKAELAAILPEPTATRERVGKLIENVVDAARTAAKAE